MKLNVGALIKNVLSDTRIVKRYIYDNTLTDFIEEVDIKVHGSV